MGDEMNDLMKAIGEHIRNYRKQQELSQEELAHRAGLHVTFIGKIERAEKVCTVESLAKILDALNITLEEFFRHIQPSSEQSETVFSQITKLVQQRSIEEQQRILEIIKLIFPEKK